jgi:hypothetical protein
MNFTWFSPLIHGLGIEWLDSYNFKVVKNKLDKDWLFGRPFPFYSKWHAKNEEGATY